MHKGRSLTQVAVKSLFGRFDHMIDFPADDSFVIVHGPNGVGKTRLLELIGALAWPLNLGVLATVPFHELRLTFSDSSTFEVLKAPFEKPAPKRRDGPVRAQGIRFSLHFEGRRIANWAPKFALSDFPAETLRLLTQAPGELTRTERAIRNRLAHGDLQPDQLLLLDTEWDHLRLTEMKPPPGQQQLPQEMRELLEDLRVHLIDTHRLLVQPREEERQGRIRRQAAQTKVEEFALDLSRRLAKELAENSRTSQERDRTYPRRLLETSLTGVASEQDIRDRYDAQEDLRRQLGDISLIDERSGVIEIPAEIEPWQRAVLWTYLEDTEAKLATFQDVLARVALLRDIVNSRFLFKRLEIDREQGFRLISDEGEELPLLSLSSGEQHELVLVYDLLFNVEPGALVLIDEPEISLHVSWQKRFISDLRRIADLVEFRTIVATHSPQIAGKWADRMVVLGPVSE